MPVKSVRFYTLALIVLDAVGILAAFTLAYILRVQFDARPLLNEVYANEFLQTFFILIPFWLLTFLSLGLYSPRVYEKRLTEYGKVAIGSFIGILIVIGYAFVIGEPVFPARLVAVYAIVIVFFVLIFGRELLRLARKILYRFQRGVQRVLIIGSTDTTVDIARRLSDTTKSGFHIVAIAGKSDKALDTIRYKSVDKALADIDTLDIDTIIQTSLFDEPERNLQIMSAAQTRHIGYSFIPGEPEFYSGKNQTDVFLGYPIISVYQTPLVGWGELLKRIFDLAAVIITSPIWLTIMLVIAMFQKLFDRGPVIFVSERLGRHGKVIGTYKFRTMKQEYSGKDAAQIFRSMGRKDLAKEYEKTRKITDDPRITTLGKFLRASSLDELPQLFNVIKGELSLVGPRPIIREEKSFYSHRAPLLFSVRPGITGLWQVSGRSDLSFAERVELELYYSQNWTFWLDIKILFKTISVVLFRKGAQ